MKHIFFAFPGGMAGLALVLFRLSASLLIGDAAGQLPRAFWLAGLFYLAALGLVVGLKTRAIAATSAAGAAMLWSLGGYQQTAGFGAFVLSALALALIGPGALSVDAARFGRRTVHLPE